MTRILASAALALALTGGFAQAQTASETTTTQTTGVPPASVAPTPAPLAPPPGVLSTTRETHAVDAYGNRVDSQSSSYRNSQGVAEDRQTTVTTAPPPPPPTTTTTTTTTQSTTNVPN